MKSNNLIRIKLLLLMLFFTAFAHACPVCERNQPKLLKGVVHGAGPDGQWDYVIMWVVIAITVVSLYYSVKWLIRPGETDPNHIKYSILNEEQS